MTWDAGLLRVRSVDGVWVDEPYDPNPQASLPGV